MYTLRTSVPIATKRLATSRGTSPTISGLPPAFSSVWVLPDPVWPYARMVPLYPSITASRMGAPTSSYTCCCSEPAPKTASKSHCRAAFDECCGASMWTRLPSWVSERPLRLSLSVGGRTRQCTFTRCISGRRRRHARTRYGAARGHAACVRADEDRVEYTSLPVCPSLGPTASPS